MEEQIIEKIRKTEKVVLFADADRQYSYFGHEIIVNQSCFDDTCTGIMSQMRPGVVYCQGCRRVFNIQGKQLGSLEFI